MLCGHQVMCHACTTACEVHDAHGEAALSTLLLVCLVLNGSVAIGALLGRAGYLLCGLACEGVLPKLDS